jgi:hypothetical protein
MTGTRLVIDVRSRAATRKSVKRMMYVEDLLLMVLLCRYEDQLR